MKTIKLIVLSLLLLGTTLFANSVATITALKGSATVLRDTSHIEAKLGFKLDVTDRIKTQDNTKVQIIFNDETIISLGKNSDFSIHDYLFEEDKEPVAKFGMLRGAIRVITGKIGKIAPQKFSVSTKTATIGIRGTNFTVIVNDDSSVLVYCTYGAISVTINGVEYVVEQGYYIEISPNGEARVLEFTPEKLKQMRKERFGLIRNRGNHTSKEAQGQQQGVVDDKLLNVTINDNTEVTIQDITEQNSDNLQNATLSLSELLASYSMNNASYSGTYLTTQQDTAMGASGIATMTIDFGSDTANLTLDNAGNQVVYNVNPTFGSTTIDIDIAQSTGIINSTGTGTSSGIFSEPTGNSINGTYNFKTDSFASSGNFDNGTYSVSTSQTLH